MPYLVVPLRRLLTPFSFCRFLLGDACPALLTERHLRVGWMGADMANSLLTVFCTTLTNARAQRDNLASALLLYKLLSRTYCATVGGSSSRTNIYGICSDSPIEYYTFNSNIPSSYLCDKIA